VTAPRWWTVAGVATAHIFPLPDDAVAIRDFVHYPEALCGWDPYRNGPVTFTRADAADPRCSRCAREATA
jgi:hypothetical protein